MITSPKSINLRLRRLALAALATFIPCGANAATSYDRPFIWVRDSEKAGILDKIANHAWATSVYNGMVSRVAVDLASHQSDRDAFLRQLPVDWSLATAKFKTIPAYSESSVRYPAEAKFNDGLDCAVLYYLTGNVNYARCAADILHNAVKTLLPVAPSTSVGNGGWIFQDDFLKEARVTGTQLPIIYDFLYSYLQSNQVYDVQTAGMVDFNFTSAQSVFRTLYQLARDHGSKDNNWSALMSTCMLNSLLALDDAAERAAALQVYLVTGSSRQASLDYDYRVYTQPGDIWPESLQYAGAVGSIRTSHMVLLERVDPGLSLFDSYPNLPLSLPRISYLRYPNGEQVSFGDGHREAGGQPFSQYELVYQHALARGRTDLTSFFGALINGGVALNQYNRSSLQDYATLGQHNEPLQLLWQTPAITEPGVSPELPRTDTLPFAGIALQRNPVPVNNPAYGLMCFVGGAAHVHSHASGMSMEIFGMGQVMGAKAGTDDYGSTLHENYYRLFASNNTVIVNGASRGQGDWSDIAINTVQTVAMEPQPFATAVSADLSFTCSSFADDKGTLAEGAQQRTMAIVRTSPTSGFYVDVFRSKSTVTNRTATTLDGPVTDQYHDYIYRNIGETTVDLTADGAALPLVSQTNRFQNDIGDAYDQPGWRYFTNTEVSHPNSQSVRARFVATVSGTARYMDMHMPAVASREYARVDSPAIVDAPSPYNTRLAPALVVRQIGEAWNKAFVTVYEPHYGGSGGTVQNVTQLLRGGVVVGMRIESTVAGKNLVHYIISNPGAAETYSDPVIDLSFTGRFGVATDNGDGTATLYLGAGSSISYRGNSVATVSGASSQAEVRFAPGQTPIVTANAPVNVVAAPSPFVTWVPTAGGTGFDWTNTANWDPGIVPSGEGMIALMNNDLSGDQTVNVNTPITLGELAVGDSSGSQTTLLQKNTAGAFLFDQTDAGMAYLTRTAGGTGDVTFKDDLNITLNDNLTVRLAGGSASSTMTIAGSVSGSGKGLTKEGESLSLILSGANSYTGSTKITGGILGLFHSQAIQSSALDTLNSVAGDAANGLKTTVSSLTFGGLSGDKALASVFTTTTGGYSGVTALTLNPETGTTPSYSGGIADGSAGMSLTKTGLGAQTLSGMNTYTGATTISANSGTLEIGGAGKLGSGSYAGAIDIGSGSTLIYSSSAAQTLGGAISGSGAIIKSTGANMLTLSGSNTAFTGSVTVNSGSLGLGSVDALGGASAITLAGGTTLRPTVQNVSITTPINLSGNATIHAPDFGTGSTVSTLTLGGAVSGSANLTFGSTSAVASNSKQTILLNSQSSYSGSTTLNPADNDANLTLKLGIANALPPATVLAVNGVAGGGSGRHARLELNGFSQTLGGLQNTAVSLRSQQILNSTSTAATLTINNTADHTFSGNINGTALELIKSGVGTQTLSGSNSYTGNTTVSAGTLSLDHSLAMQNSALDTLNSVAGNATNGLKTTVTSLTLGGLIGDKALASVFTTTSGGYPGVTALTLNPATGATLSYSGGIADGSAGMSLTKTGLGAQALSGVNTYTGSTTISANSGTLEIGGAGKLGNGSYAGAIDIGSGSTLKYSSSAAQTLGGAISGSGAIIKSTGTNALTLSGANTGFTGSVTILAGKLGLGHVNALSGAGAITLAGGTSLIPNVQNAVINAPITLSDGGTTTINAPTVVGGGGSTPVPFTLNGPIGGTGSVTFNGTQNTNAYGTIILNAASDYSGSTLMTCSGSSNTEMFVHLGIANALPVTTVLTMDGGDGTGSGRFTTLDLKGFNQTLAGLTNIARSLRFQRVVNTSATAATLTLNTTTDCSFSGSLATNSGNGNFGLTKTGPGRLTLSGANAYTGATIISAGTLALGANNVLPDTTAISIANATLDAATHADTAGTLEVAGNATIQLDAGATLAFADSNAIDWSSGTLNVTGTFVAGSSLRFGTTSSGLTASQLALIAIDGAAMPLALDANGYLVQTAGGYAAWKAANAPNTGSNPNADEDGDGVSNGIEYLLGGTIAADDIGRLPEIATAGGNMVFSFVRDQASIDGSTTVEIEVGDNLATWPTRYPVPGTALADNPGVTVGKDHPAAGMDTITLTLPQASDTAKFIRLKMTMP